jgi:hypothetical protein
VFDRIVAHTVDPALAAAADLDQRPKLAALICPVVVGVLDGHEPTDLVHCA